MNSDEAREEAWQLFSGGGRSVYHLGSFKEGWDARGRYDEQCIAELVAALDWNDAWQDYENEMSELGRVISPEMAFGTACERLIDRLRSTLRALGQSEEVKP